MAIVEGLLGSVSEFVGCSTRESESERPEALCNSSSGIGLMHPVVTLHVSFRLAFIYLVCADLFHNGHPYSGVEKHNPCADALSTVIPKIVPR